MAPAREHQSKPVAGAAGAPRRPNDILPGDKTDSDMVYLGHRPVAQVAVRQTEPDEALANTPTTSIRATTRRRGQGRRPRRPNPVPSELWNKCIALGSVKGKPKQKVVGFFGNAGRFALKVQHPGRKPSENIKHDDVEYRGDFRGLSAKNVRKEVLRRLLQHVGPLQDPGEF